MQRIYILALRVQNAVESQLRKFHRNERGETTVMTNIMLLAIAALIVIALIVFGEEILKWIGKKWKEMSERNPSHK